MRNRDGKPIKLVLSWLTGHELSDNDIVTALGVDKNYFSRHKDDDGFPSFEDLDKLATHFGLDARALQISFGYRDIDELILLDHQGMYEYMEMGGANHPNPDRDDVAAYVQQLVDQLRKVRSMLPPHAVKPMILKVARNPEEITRRLPNYGKLSSDGEAKKK